MSSSTLLRSLFKYKSWADEELFGAVATLDPATHPAELQSAIRVLNHIHVVDRIFAAHLSGQEHGFKGTNTAETPTLEALRGAVAESDRWYEQHVEALPPESLPEHLRFTFTDGEQGQMSREEMLAHVVTHGGYHRGAVGRILAQVSTAPPRDLLTRYLHQSEPGRRAKA